MANKRADQRLNEDSKAIQDGYGGSEEPRKGAKPTDVSVARKRLHIAIEATNQNRLYQVDDMRFAAGSPDNKFQWPSKLVAARENDPNGPRPCLTINKTRQHNNQIINDADCGKCDNW